MVINVLRENIGARNPYALADAKNGARIDWEKIWNAEGPDGIKKKLNSILQRPPDRLFDPKYESPLYVKKENLESVNVGATSPCNAYLKTWGAYKPTGLSGLWFTPEAKAMFDDPTQGCVPDCYFIAALSSVAWTADTLIASMARAWSTAGINAITINFWSKQNINGVSQVVKTPILVKKDLPLTDAGNLAFSSSKDLREVWPSIYEKAYALFMNLGSTDADVDHANIPKFSGGSPMNALFHITGKEFSTDTNNNPTAFITKNMNPDAVYNTLLNKCQVSATASKKTLNPTVAWTYHSATDAPGVVTYSEDMIAADHSYSILGVHTDKATGSLCIVLRNPYGAAWCNDPKNPADAAIYTLGTSDLEFTGMTAIPLSKPDGIFALDYKDFTRYFEGFGWVPVNA
jgi:hypothetical protein